MSETLKPLSERPLGYVLAVVGGTLGLPIGWIASPLVLWLLNKNMQGKEGKQPNRFAVWALIGIVGAPLSLLAISPFVPPPPEEPKPAALTPAPTKPVRMTPGQKFLKAKLAELDQIRETPGFREYKFSATGPYAGWPDKLKAEAEKKDLGMWEMGGVNFLALLASNYASSGGVDDSSTDQARSHVQEVIDTPQ